MKRLLIIRHAKSSWDYPELSDFERPLNQRGKKDLPDMAQRLKDASIPIDQWLSSPAKRAITTAIGHAKALGVKEKDILQDQRLYHASSKSLQLVISETENWVQNLAIFGHNPGLTDLINNLSDFDLWNLPTCAIVGIELPINSWAKIFEHKGSKFHYDYPKSRKH